MMRKSLLMTSAMALAGLPTLAMASAASSSSSLGGTCSSGFFAGVTAKILNAKLEIKNKDKKVDDASKLANEDVTVDGVRGVQVQLQSLKKVACYADGVLIYFPQLQTTPLRLLNLNYWLMICAL